ncbi:amidohydrolase [Pseudomonas sp. Bc-h]|jgi:L-fuconolactonase|uniref:amidohydrolase family protein n=1 Tax=Pseudomonas sp. Bc-h TaxID=1943632 RepID=UPI0009DAA18C|nr:amidohydrolase family protein [Pseudomonas sp. Bc-h]OQR26432.1 amidohydrolase [Pseudomonas sp. Bc-h]
MSSQDTRHPPPPLRVDAHQHFWRYRAQDYPWIDDRHGALRHDFMPDDLKPLLDQHGIAGCVAVQARHSRHETDALLALADQYPWVLGVVGWVDLRATDLERQLEGWSDNRKLVGIRHQIQDEPSPSLFMQDPVFARGVSLLQARGLVYDLLIKDADLHAAADFCKRHDEHHIILDHLGKPDLSQEDPIAWADRIAPLAALPHVSCKLSGLITEADWQQWRPVELLPYFYLALELFGPQRLMFGSDWPVCQVAGSYSDVHRLLESALHELSADEQAAIGGGTAIRLYGLQGNCP